MIPLNAVLRLFEAIIGKDQLDQTRFTAWMVDGISLHPDLSMQDPSTLARIAAGEAYGFNEDGSTR